MFGFYIKPKQNKIKLKFKICYLVSSQMSKLQIVDGIFSLDGKYGQYTLKNCERDQHTFWLPKPYPNTLGKSIIAFTEPYAAIFPGIENFPETPFNNLVITGTIHRRDSDKPITGSAKMLIAGGDGCCYSVNISVIID